MGLLFRRLWIILVIFAFAEVSPADEVVFSQPPLAGGEGFLSELEHDQNADNFSFVARTLITSVRWWGTYFAPEPEPDQFSVRFFDDDAGMPNLSPTHDFTGLTVSRSDSGLVDMVGDTIYEYQTQLPSSVEILANSTTYLSVLNNTLDGWFWQQNSSTGSNWFRLSGDESAWNGSSSGNFSFELVGTEPLAPTGDYNDNGLVEQTDLDLVLLNWGDTWPPEIAGWVNQQPTDDGVINQNDLDSVLLNWGNSTVSAATVVPEPTALVLLLAAGLLVCCRARG